MARPTRLRFAGHVIETKDADGNVIRREPERFYAWAPARDLDENDLAAFDAAELKTLISQQADGSKPLYVVVDDSPKADEKPAAEKGKQ